MHDMIDEVMTHVDFLPDVLAVRQVSREIYRWSRAVPDRRRERILRRFFLDSLEHFLTVMGETGTIITGSCALNMLLGNRYDACSSDLNLNVPHEMFFTMDVFLRNLAGYVTAEKQMEPHSSVASSVARFVIYRKSELAISLTQAGVLGPMRVIVCSTSTADMTFMASPPCTPNSHYTARTYAPRTRSGCTGGKIELDHQRVTLLLWKVICAFWQNNMVALVPHSGVRSKTMGLMGFSTGTGATMSSECSRIVMWSGE
ncbi:hypothetical protein M405DRAFT_830794 [Rhizopogon salebrosus TDB-379]|nr:hypothetical protein M405DRAFT_830794 [Rhizopogon salebrosus TDB-379]